MGKDNHFTDEELEELHQPKNGAEGRGCLIRHQPRTEDHQCSHQWQARVKAESDDTVYNYPAYKKLCGSGKFKTAARTARSDNPFPRDYADLINGYYMKDKPTHKGKEWDLGKGQNFNHWLKPYWHNAHHIIPNTGLKRAINDSADEYEDARLPNIIRYCLLKGSYNLNDQVNMIILPQGRVVAETLGLPRHLKGDEVGPDEKKEFFSHLDYSQNMKNKIDKVIVEYVESLESALENHPEPPTALSKSKLERISKITYDSIKNIKPEDAGKALSDLNL